MIITFCSRSINEVDNQILTCDRKGITKEQLNKFRASFNLFDKSGKGKMAPDDLKNCLISLGYPTVKDNVVDSIRSHIVY